MLPQLVSPISLMLEAGDSYFWRVQRSHSARSAAASAAAILLAVIAHFRHHRRWHADHETQ